MKPKAANEHEDGLLEYLEDIIGTRRFLEPINDLRIKVDELGEIRSEKYNRVKITEKERSNLEPARQEALEFVDKENERNKIKAILLKNKLYKIECNDGEVLMKRKDMEESIANLELENTQKQTNLNEINTNLDNNSKEISILIKKIEKMRSKGIQLEKEYNKRVQEKNYVTDKLEKLLVQIEDNKERKKELDSNFKNSQESLEKMISSKEQLSEELKTYEESYNTLMVDVKKNTAHLTIEKNEISEAILKKNKELSNESIELEKLKSECETMKFKESNILSQIKSCQNQIESCNEFLEINHHERITNEIHEHETELDKLQFEMTALKEKEAQMQTEYKEKFLAFENQKSCRASSVKNNLCEALMKAQKKGEISGIYGRMGDLACISNKYDCAVSTAFPALDNILVESMDVAKTCVEFLRKHNLGTATFIGLDRMETWKNKIKGDKFYFKAFPDVSRLFDLIEVTEEKFYPAFYFVMRDTLVANDIDVATKVAYYKNERWRVVTMNGELIEKSGTISGGGTYKNSGKMSLSSGDKISSKNISAKYEYNIEKLESEIDELKSSISVTKKELNNLKNSFDAIKKLIPQKKTQLKKVSFEVDAKKRELEDLNTNLGSLKTNLQENKPDESLLNNIELDIKDKTTKIDKMKNTVEKLKTKETDLSEEIQNISNKILQQVQYKMNSVTRLLEQTSTEISKNNAIISNHKKQSEKYDHELKEHLKEQKKLEKKIEEFRENNSENFDEVYNMEKDKIEKDIVVSEKELHELKSSLDTLQYDASKLQMEIEKIKIQLVENRGDYDKLVSKCKSLTATIDAIKLELCKLNVDFTNDSEWQRDENDLITLEETLCSLENFLKNNKVNLKVIEEYNEKVSIYMERLAELDDISSQRDNIRNELDQLNKERLNEFIEGFSIINSKLKEFYQLITFGGDAELEFVDSLDPFIDGIVFSVRPPNKSWKIISNLSGGEKTLSSLALVFALHYYKPSPFYVMDEIDAALDFKNVSIIANYIKERTRNSQFIIISLRNNMFELANILVGIYKTHDCTKSIIVDPHKILLDH